MLKLFTYTLLSGIPIFLGGIASNYFNRHIKDGPIKNKVIHFMMSFGGGIVLSAVALVLIPKSMEKLSLWGLCFSFIIGAISFFLIDRYLHRKAGKVGMLLAMVMDFIPESIILGSLLLTAPKTALFLAIFMGLQNFPEAFTAFRNIVLSGFRAGKVLFLFFLLSFVGVISALFGYFFLKESPTITAGLMSFASGGILYLLFQDISPDARIKGVYITGIGAVFGFLLGMIGDMLL